MRLISYDSSLQNCKLVHDLSCSPCQLYFHYVKCVVFNRPAHHRHVYGVHLHRISSSKETMKLIGTQQCNCWGSGTLSQQDRHWTHNVTLNNRVMLQRKIIKYYIFWESVCSPTYPTCNARAPYCLSVGFPAVQYFFIFSHKRHDFQKKKKSAEHKMCVSIFSANFVWNISHFKNKWARYDKKYISVFM